MGFRHSVFISYRNGRFEQGTLNTVANQLYTALCNEMEMWNIGDMFMPVFLDQQAMRGAPLINDIFSEAVYYSCTFIVVFTPNYFSNRSPFCASELEGMLRREQEFRQLLQNNNISCIIPIILRGRDQIPDLLTVRRYYADFCDFDPDVEGTPPIHRHPKLKPLVREIVEYIDSVSANLRNQEGELCRNSANFVLIDFESQEGLQEITNFIDTNRPNRPPYPHLY